MLKVMIAEDDLMMADMLEDVLVEGGYEVCGIARTVDKAVELANRHKPDLAVLDLQLAEGGLGTDIAARLNHQGRPGVLYATGNASHASLTKADGEACLDKPYRPEDVVRALKIVEQIVVTGEASRSFPRGFHILEQAPANDAYVNSANSGLIRQIARIRRQQAALAGFGGFALGESDLGKVLTEAARVCAEGLDVPFCKVCRYRSEENDLLVEAGVGWHRGVVGHVVSQANEGSPQGRAFITGQPVICGDLTTDVSFMLPAFYAEHGIVSTVDVVIRKKDGQPYGVLEIDNPVQQDYDHHDIDFLTGFANVLAEAVDTSKRNTTLQSAVDRMQDMLVDRDRLLASKNLVLSEKMVLLKKEASLREEKEVLAQELHHRVRNNLQLVYGMLSKQLQVSTDAAGKEGFSAIARSVMALAQVYDHLHGAGLSRTMDFGSYLSSLCESFRSLENAQHPLVGLTCQWEPVILDLDCVTALGLVVTELIANSYTHAFPDGTGTISVSLTRGHAGDQATLIFGDDGVGFVDSDDSRRHGVGLVRRLMEQVNGSVELHSDRGTEWILKFPVPTSPSDGMPIPTT
jgi:two-component sensor histidine kinase/ActR/RegA family two-component response regulator/putative methionine-R-sulfoxide reductase with GAF domain